MATTISTLGFGLLAAASTAAAALGIENPDSAKPLEIPFFEKAPALDGKLSDDAWAKAALISGFRKYGSGDVPEKNTKVRLGYDTQNLYIAVECSHPAQSALKAIVNQEFVDAPVFGDDCVELFFAGGEKSPAYHLAATSRCVRWDALEDKPELWDGRWEVACSRGEDCWIAEFKIPFLELPSRGNPCGTPAAGSTWWMNFARNAAEKTEWTQWSFSKNGGFADRSCFRPVVFGPRPKPFDIDVRIAGQGLMSIGSSELVVEAGNITVSPVEFTCSLSRKTAEGWKSEIIFLQRPQQDAQSLKLNIPYKITRGGEYRLSLETKTPKVQIPLNVWTSAFEVVDLAGPLARLSEIAGHCRRLASGLNDSPVRKEGENALEGLEKGLKLIQAGAADEKTLTAEIWAELRRKASESVAAGDKLERRLQKQAWMEEISAVYPNAEFCIGITTPFEQIFREDLFSGKINQGLRLQSARNEMEDAQVVLIPLVDDDLSDVLVGMSDMKLDGGDAVLPSKQWWIGAVGYIERPRPANCGEDFRAFWPDVLLPAGPIKVEPGRQQPVFLRVTVPEGQTAGTYRGTLTVRGKSTVESLPVELEVWDFALPMNSSLQTDSWFTFKDICSYYKTPEVTMEQYERILRDFQGYRISMYPIDYFALGPKIRLFREKDNSLTVDFTDFDPYFDMAIKYGATSINLNLSCSSGIYTMFAGGWGYAHLKITDRETGKVSPYPAECHWPPKQNMFEDPDFISFWKQYWKHAKEKGWDKVAYVEDVDEPGSGDRKKFLLESHAFFRKNCPGLPLLSFGTTPSGFKDSIGLIDWWAPLLRVYGEDADTYRERQRKFGERVWVYTCGDSGKNMKGYTPDTYIHTPLIDKRIVPLMCWKLEIQGLFQFTFNSFGANPDLIKKGVEKQWGQYPILHAPPTECQFGIGNLVWPGPELCQLLPSLRLEMKRDGMEDYEYLVVLREMMEKLRAVDSPEAKTLRDEAAKYMQVPDDLVTDAYVWSHDPGKLLAWRAGVAGLILKLRKFMGNK